MRMRWELAALLVIASTLLGGCIPTEVALRSEGRSPDGLLTVAVYTSDSGATSSVLTVVNIRPTRDAFGDREERGNVFSAFHAGQVDAEWKSNEEVVVKVQGQPRVVLQVVKLWDTAITYEGEGVGN